MTLPRGIPLVWIALLVFNALLPGARSVEMAAGFECYGAANKGGAAGGDDLLTSIALDDFNPATNETSLGSGTGTFSIASLAYQPSTGALYAVNDFLVGTVTSGTFARLPKTLGQGRGALGTQTYNDVQGLAFDPSSEELFAVVHKAGPDLLIEVDPATGAALPNSFGSSDYLVIAAAGGKDDIADIAISPADARIYAVATDGSGASDLVTIDRANGATAIVGSLGADIQGLSFSSDAALYGVAGGELYRIGTTDGAASAPRPLDNGADYRGLACPLGPTNVIAGRVFWDHNGDGILNGTDSGTENVTLGLYRDVDRNGVVDRGEPLIRTLTTAADGSYTASIGSQGAFAIEIAPKSLPKGHKLTTPVHQQAVFDATGLTASGKDFGHMPHAAKADEVIVAFKSDVPQTTIDTILAGQGLKVKRHNDTLNSYLCTTPVGQADAIVASLSTDPAVAYAERNYIIQGALTPTDPDYNNSALVYAPQLINAPAAWDLSMGSNTVTVAVLDSGLALSHQEFTGRVVACKNAQNQSETCDFVNTDSDPSDDQGHGTHVTGILAAAMNNGGMVGIAPSVKILPVKVLAADNTGTAADVAEGLTYIANNAAAKGIRIANMSLALTTVSAEVEAAFNKAVAANILMVVGAGNTGGDIAVWPSAYPEAFTVGATDAGDNLWPASNWGSWMDIMAPGTDIYSSNWTSANATSGYTKLTGTSMSSPHVAGLAALLISYKPSLTNADLIALIQNNAVDLGQKGWDKYYGAGRIDAGASLAAADSWTPSTFTPTPSVTPTATPTQTPTPTATATPAPYRQTVNAGGSAYTDTGGVTWAADKAFATGSWGYSTGSAKSSTTSINGTNDDPLYQKYRTLAGDYKFTVPNGAYSVKLRFAELSVTAAGSRVMKVTIEGNVVESALDVYMLAGKATALDRFYSANVSDGVLNITFAIAKGRNNPIVSGIEVAPSVPPTPTITPGGPTLTPTSTSTPTATPTSTRTPTATATQPPYLQRVNAGGSSYTDTLKQTWAADKAWATGSWGYAAGSAKSTSTGINGTTDDLLYQKYRLLAGEYKFTVPNGTYQVTLKFAEPSVSAAASRVMQITLEMSVVEPALDIYAVAGKVTALDKTYTIAVSDGVLNIGFARNGGSNDPIVSAIEVRQQ